LKVSKAISLNAWQMKMKEGKCLENVVIRTPRDAVGDAGPRELGQHHGSGQYVVAYHAAQKGGVAVGENVRMIEQNSANARKQTIQERRE
jgi:hypothetical protein